MLWRASIAVQMGNVGIGLGVSFTAGRQVCPARQTTSPSAATTHLSMHPFAPGSGFGHLTPTPISEPGCDRRNALSMGHTNIACPRGFAPTRLMEDAFHERGSMAKAILLLDPDGLALAPAILCAEAAEEARRRNLPLFDHILAQLSAGAQLRPNGEASYELLQAGQRVAVLEIFETPSMNGTDILNR